MYKFYSHILWNKSFFKVNLFLKYFYNSINWITVRFCDDIVALVVFGIVVNTTAITATTVMVIWLKVITIIAMQHLWRYGPTQRRGAGTDPVPHRADHSTFILSLLKANLASMVPYCYKGYVVVKYTHNKYRKDTRYLQLTGWVSIWCAWAMKSEDIYSGMPQCGNPACCE